MEKTGAMVGEWTERGRTEGGEVACPFANRHAAHKDRAKAGVVQYVWWASGRSEGEERASEWMERGSKEGVW